MVISVLLGVLLGTGIAQAHALYKNLSVGWNYFDGTHSESEYSYSEAHWEWMKSDRTEVRVDDTRYFNGTAEDQYWVFGPLYIYDEYGRDTQVFWNFVWRSIDAANYWADTDWTMDELDASNDTVWVHQYIWDCEPTCSYAESQYMIAYTGQ